MVDLFRIKGVSEEYSELLQVSGVNSVPELAERNSEHLYDQSVGIFKKMERYIIRTADANIDLSYHTHL